MFDNRTCRDKKRGKQTCTHFSLWVLLETPRGFESYKRSVYKRRVTPSVEFSDPNKLTQTIHNQFNFES
jgi:hypothetical protein